MAIVRDLTKADTDYRRSLGIGGTDPLPKSLGAVTRNAPVVKRPRTQVFR